ncbi:uncharacterized protein B0H18DRAFT_1118148 [Fomitopsis serialis]|uniref:uncharacterized protein n=1 Tax=Fomitopsis serialis TaxID=139415 RepID=UPI0020089A94|nr:uncharacterized protein B0H18DRAFT_1118148 [Neoantrodia serialis]KAH9928129.1 hypothetical protein B0H18DRAFT_1118148 [Neoantrodia serialis]
MGVPQGTCERVLRGARPEREYDSARRWGWRFVGCGSWEGRGKLAQNEAAGVGRGGGWKSAVRTSGLDSVRGARRRKGAALPDDLDRVRADLTNSMLDLAQEKGCEFVRRKVTSIIIDESEDRVSGVIYTVTAPTADGQ